MNHPTGVYKVGRIPGHIAVPIQRHGFANSIINEIYDYAAALTAANRSFELKVYSHEPHGFMLENGQLRQDDVAQDAFQQMVTFFQRKLG